MRNKNNHFKRKKCNLHLIAMVLMVCIFSAKEVNAQTYPFTNLPDTIKASYKINTLKKEAFNRNLLGYNVYFDFNNSNLINAIEPIGVRFPVGTPGNFYNWETDMFTRYTDTLYNNGVYGTLIDSYIKSNHKEGFPTLVSLNNTRKQQNKPAFDVIWTYSVNYDNNKKVVARLQDSDAKGMDVKDIEIGNEMFWKQQGSTRVSTPEKYLAVARSVSDTLKSVKPSLQLSIPVSPKTTHKTYNEVVTSDSRYFDAITVHKYVGADPDEPGQSNTAYANILTGRLDLLAGINYARSFAPTKPVWLTEWAVSAGNDCHAAAALSMADCYLYMFNHQSVFKRINWFSVNGTANSFVTFTNGRTVKYPLELTGYAQVFKMLRDVFEGSDMYEDSMSVVQLTSATGSMDAVSAKAVVKDGKTSVFATNLTNKPAILDLSVDNAKMTQSYMHYTMKYDSLSENRIHSINDNPLTLLKSGIGEIILPPLSVNKIVFSGENINDSTSVHFLSPANGDTFSVGSDLNVKAVAGSAIKTVDLYINNQLVRSITGSPYEWGTDTLIDSSLSNLQAGIYNLKLVASDALSKTTESTISVEVKNPLLQSPYAGEIQVPGTLEAENYDLGSEGESYHDSDGTNQGAVYRTEGVDIGEFSPDLFNIGWTVNGEWLEYTINVAETGLYDVGIVYSAGRTTPAKIGLDLSEEGTVLFSNFNLPITGNWNTYTTLTKTGVQLTAGKQILRLNIITSGCNIDKLIFSKVGASYIKSVKTNIINVFPNPSSDGQFHLSKNMEWQIYTIDGTKILKGEGTKIDLSAYRKGIYIGKAQHTFFKMIKE